MRRIISKSGLSTDVGSPYELGATPAVNGCNFALFSKNATKVNLLLFEKETDSEPSCFIELDPKLNKTGDIWHIFLYGIGHGQLYGYTVDGPYHPEMGHRFNVNKLLLDPYARAVCGNYDWDKESAYGYDIKSKLGDLSFSHQKNFEVAAKAAVVDHFQDFDWGNDKPLNIPKTDTIIYEMHVRGFTVDPSSGVEHPGTYLGAIEKIPYLKKLGVTTVELLPVHGFNHLENTNYNPKTKERLVNFWGYSTLAFLAPNAWYSAKKNGLSAVRDFKEMVKAFHQEGIEVILDVVYNHTGEGNEFGPTHSFRGLDNSIYYMLENGRYYKNYSGCGNTLNCNHPVVKRLLKESLRYWVVDMHVDGFRFDLAAILGRDSNGHWVPDYSVLSEIAHDPILSHTKLIAEGWDAAGLYKVGGFPGGWAEWNGKFRDDVRSFTKGDEGKVGHLASRLSGSTDIFYFKDKRPYHSINFITAHDGFTLNDLVSYNDKHNFENSEENRDGENHNLSWNHGVEGDTTKKDILDLRDRQMKNLFTVLMISQGTPMVLCGDEMKFSKKGNNNTYCHDNRMNWIDWNLLEKNRAFYEFCSYMISFRKRHPIFRRKHFLFGIDRSGNNIPDVSWHGVNINSPDFSYISHSLAFMLDGAKDDTGWDEDDNTMYIAMNSYWDDLWFELPKPPNGKKWYKAIDTYEAPGFFEVNEEPEIKETYIHVKARSTVLLLEK
ncbi:MAG: glycogen debranching protein GlgX [Leptospiraceae bacterium]|nr:glycogen debranching protein GlgX [Leptospiraceae bacterium]MCP5498206.1 glycogen debranching protein GlgX [Leptospiraceae bacterium]